HGGAGRAIDRGVRLNRNCAEAWTAKGWVACYQSDPGVAIEAFDRALRLSPLDPALYHIAAGRALAHMVAEEYEQAIEWADRSLSAQSHYGPALRTRIIACAQVDRLAEAQASLARMLELQPDLTIAAYRVSMSTNFSPQLLDLYSNGLRKAGLLESWR